MTKRTTLGFVDPDEQTYAIIGRRMAAALSQDGLPGWCPDKGSGKGVAHQKETKRPERAMAGTGTNGGYHAPCRNR